MDPTLLTIDIDDCKAIIRMEERASQTMNSSGLRSYLSSPSHNNWEWKFPLTEEAKKAEVGYAYTWSNKELNENFLEQVHIEPIEINYPGLLSTIIPSTSTSFIKSIHIHQELLEIIKNTSNQENDLEDNIEFEHSITEWTQKWGKYSSEAITDLNKSGLIEEDYLCVILEIIGMINNFESYEDRFDLLLYFLGSSSPKLRYGAIIGFSNLDSPKALMYLEQMKEETPILSRVLEKVIIQLKNQ